MKQQHHDGGHAAQTVYCSVQLAHGLSFVLGGSLRKKPGPNRNAI
jgi:hypothetical protein